MKTIMILTALLLLGGCAFLQKTAADINTPENREKAAVGLVKAAQVSCGAAVGYFEAVGPQLEGGGADGIATLRETCVEAERLPAPVEAPLPAVKPEVTS